MGPQEYMVSIVTAHTHGSSGILVLSSKQLLHMVPLYTCGPQEYMVSLVSAHTLGSSRILGLSSNSLYTL